MKYRKDLYMCRAEYTENEIVIYLSGRIDSNNAPEAEKQILSCLKDRKEQDVTIDAGELNYISSAGLRVILHIRKMIPTLSIVNVSSEVYDILDMTGFTQMMDVKRSYREVSVEGAELIGKGANGKLYRIDSDNVVKVYNNPDALDDISMEREKARIALVLGIPTAISYDVVKVNGHYGSVFELLNASSFANILAEEPERFDWCVKEFTELLLKIHGTVVPEGKLPRIKQTAIGWLSYLKDFLPEEAYDKAYRLITDVPEDDHMIHGDYHTKNVVLQGDEVLLIDMDTLAVGHPIFELASMYNAFRGFSEYDHSVLERFHGIPYETGIRFWNCVMKTYLGTQDVAKVKAVEDKARIVGYIRLIRRSLRRGGMDSEKGRAEISLWNEELLDLLSCTDTLLFDREQA